MTRSKRYGVGMMAVLALAGVGCSKSESSAKAKKVDAYDFRFEPTSISVKAGSEVSVAVGNEGKALHSFTINDLSVDTDVQPDKHTTVKFTAPSKPGTVAFVCKYHAGRGMKGTITVT